MPNILLKNIIIIALLLTIFTANVFGFSTQAIGHKNIDNTKNDYVVLLHGILIGSWQMHPLSTFFAEQGYEVINIAYPSTDYNLEKLSSIVAADIKKRIIIDKPVHFIGYSMGGLVIRATLKKYKPKIMGRVVQIATPNKGSEIADRLKNNIFYKFLYGPAGQQLITDQSKIKSLFGPIDYDLGIIAGYGANNFIFKKTFDGENDGTVAVNKVFIAGCKDYIKIRGTHFFMPFDTEVKSQALHFIKHGKFE